MKYYLGLGENFCFKMALEFLSCVQTALLSASYDNIILKAKQVICLQSMYLKKDLFAVLSTGLLALHVQFITGGPDVVCVK